MTILIADSGSTKCDWLAITERGQELGEFHTMGFNPYFHDADLVEREMNANSQAMAMAGTVDRVFFYGAGSSSPELCAVIAEGLRRVFTNAEVHVGHDLDGAAYSTYTGEPAVTCILGTGSNSCLFDGTTVSEEVPALAYVLGDEGSGSWFGKKLLAGFLYGQLPEVIHADFEAEYTMALTNRSISADVEAETVFVLPSLEFSHLSSRHIKEIAAFGGDVHESLPGPIAGGVVEELKLRLKPGSLEN